MTIVIPCSYCTIALSLTVKKAKNTKIIGLQFGKTNFCSYLCSNTRYYHPRVFANL